MANQKKRPWSRIQVQLAEVMTAYSTETESYPLAACISDTGGAAGLFLGLHVMCRLKGFQVQLLNVNFSYSWNCDGAE